MNHDDATALHVEFGLLLGDRLLNGGSLLVTQVQGYACYGEHRHFRIEPSWLEVILFDGLLIQHRFELPACPVEMRLLRVIESGDERMPLRQEQVFNSELRMGVHRSADWESIALDQHTLAFRCTPLRV